MNIVRLVYKGVFFGSLLTLGFAIAFLSLAPPVTTLRERSILLGESGEAIGPESANWTPLEQISRHMLRALVIAEDGRFFEHDGLDWHEILKSVVVNVQRRRFARGASTLTQQTVKLAFLTPEKTILRKLKEAAGALMLEQHLSKEEILEWYLNLAPFGAGKSGIAAAAAYYFDTKPALLSVAQSIHLALILPSPNRWSEGLRQRELTEFGHSRFASILIQMLGSRWITKEQWITTMASGDFGRPISGFDVWLARQNAKQEKPLDCTLEPEECMKIFSKELWDEATDSLIFPPESEESELHDRQRVAIPRRPSGPSIRAGLSEGEDSANPEED